MIKKFIRQVLSEDLFVHLQAADHYLNGEPEIRLLRHLCDKSRISLDIGANIGTYTYFMRRHSRAIYAYEPNPELAQRLERLFPDVTVRNAAASDKSGVLSLRIPVEGGKMQHELASVAQDFESTEDVREFTVKAMPIDDEGLEDVGFIKIDVEQHELPVLEGCMKTIDTCRPAIMSEVTPLLYPSALPDMFRFLTDLDYEGWFKFDRKYLPFADFSAPVHANPEQFGGRFMNSNVIFLPNEFDKAFLLRSS
jgi:FkbM family methyltransferase